MQKPQYDKVCYKTERREERIPLKNIKSGAIGYSYLCTEAGTTVQVRLENGELDSWEKEDCVEVADEKRS